MKKKLLLFISVLTLSLTGNAQLSGYAVGDIVANFTVTDTEGNVHDLHTITASGKYVYIDFFFDTCGPCQGVSPIYNEFYDKYGCNTGDVYCMTMNNGSDNDAETIAYEQSYGGTFNHGPAISNEGGATAVTAAFIPGAFPTICLIGPDNKMVNTDIWPVSSVAQLEASFPAGFAPTAISCSLTLDEKKSIEGLNIFPNPALNNVNVSFSANTSSEIIISIVNILGETMKTINTTSSIGNNTIELDVNDYSNGQYIVNISGDNQNTTTKFSIVK